MSHRYSEFEDTTLWRAIDAVFAALEANGDVQITTARTHVLGFACAQLSAAHVVVTTSDSMREAADARRRARNIQESIRRILIHDWDPLGVRDIAEAADEYDGYVGAIYGLLASGADEDQVATHLEEIDRDAMGLEGSRKGARAVAKRLRALNVTVGHLGQAT